MNKELKSDWWIFTNITFLSAGICYLIALVLMLIGNFIDVKVSQEVFMAAIIVIWGLSIFLGVKTTFMGATIDKKGMIKVLVYNLLLYVVVSLRAIPAVFEFAKIAMNPVLTLYVIPVCLSVVMTLFIGLMMFNFKEE